MISMSFLLQYRLRCMMRNKTLLFWTFLFPIALITMFGLVLKDSFVYEKVESIPIAIVDNAAYREDLTFQSTIKNVKQEGKKLFALTLINEAKQKDFLKNEDHVAIISLDDGIQVEMSENGISQSIVKMFCDEYLQQKHMITTLLQSGVDPSILMQSMPETKTYVEKQQEKNSDPTNIYFYTALAMSALFGGYWAIHAIGDIQANQSAKGARIAMAPTNKMLHLGSSLILSFVVQFVFLMVQLVYMNLVFQVALDEMLWYVILLLSIASIAGSGLGSLIGVVFVKIPKDGKDGILSAITMFCSFLSGMMMITIKNIIHTYMPILAYINPCTMISDALYSLYYYGVNQRYFSNIILLIVFSVVCYVFAYFFLNRKSYDSLEVK